MLFEVINPTIKDIQDIAMTVG